MSFFTVQPLFLSFDALIIFRRQIFLIITKYLILRLQKPIYLKKHYCNKQRK